MAGRNMNTEFEALTKLLYEVISAPHEERDRASTMPLFHPRATMVRTGIDKSGQPFALATSHAVYIANVTELLKGVEFEETELRQEATVFGRKAMMIKQLGRVLLVGLGFIAICTGANAANSDVLEPFRDFDNSSKYAINYDDLSALLRAVVVDVGISTRRVAQEAADVTGTRMKPKIKKTANEGNRFYFETFEGNEESREFLRNIQAILEEPSRAGTAQVFFPRRTTGLLAEPLQRHRVE